MLDRDRSALAGTSVAAHLTRGAIGFGLIAAAVALTPSVGPAALLLAPPGMVALRGCPTCWTAGLIQTISAGRLKRSCTENSCTLHPPRLERTRPRKSPLHREIGTTGGSGRPANPNLDRPLEHLMRPVGRQARRQAAEAIGKADR
jgi:hypothetical protein